MSEVEAQAPRVADGSITARPATDETRSGDLDRGRAGVAPIKAEYILPVGSSTVLVNEADDDAAEGSTSTAQPDSRDAKRRKTGGPADKKKNRGQNKNRDLRTGPDTGPKMCRAWEMGTCDHHPCKFSHDWSAYFEAKPRDLPKAKEYSVDEPFVLYEESEVGGGDEDKIGRAIDLKTACPVYLDLGYCPFGWKCRFLGGHVKRVSPGEGAEGSRRVGEWEMTCDTLREEKEGWKNGETNWPDHKIFSALRKCTYDYPITRKYLQAVEPEKPFTLTRSTKPKPNLAKKPAPTLAEQPDIASEDVMYDEEAEMNAQNAAVASEEDAMNAENGVVDGQAEAMDVPLRPEEKRRLNWENGLYLAPLTTVGNLPFRRLCTTLGATITVSEMALAQPLISGQDNEWALCRRHSSEKNFGIQLAGSYPNRMVPAAELIARELGASDKSGKGVDFVDVNLGCPIDLVFNQGAGSALLDVPGRLGKILVGMNRALGEIPLTVKFRTGVASGKPNAHKLIPRFATEWGTSALTLHGRSRQQRYSKLADWEYIRQCTSTLRESLSDAGLPPVPMFGNGDCFSSQQYYEEKEKSGVDGVMIARGALIKPWIFTEVAERREWDISATERLDIVKKYAEFGLTHWGSDHLGIQKTRRFLCEFLSFTHRYIPIGLLERMPPQMNERPPKFRGRNELETLLASDNSADWVKISEMFLGKAGESFGWVPKHKSNAYGGEEAQG